MLAKSVPKQLWNILNRFSEKSRKSVDVSLDELYNYFKEMNEVENDDIEIVINLCISVNLSSSITR
jgi:Asp-tRNA(Asn)/Glu-tRNA(Gln) amidotransferase C subunit